VRLAKHILVVILSLSITQIGSAQQLASGSKGAEQLINFERVNEKWSIKESQTKFYDETTRNEYEKFMEFVVRDKIPSGIPNGHVITLGSQGDPILTPTRDLEESSILVRQSDLDILQNRLLIDSQELQFNTWRETTYRSIEQIMDFVDNTVQQTVDIVGSKPDIKIADLSTTIANLCVNGDLACLRGSFSISKEGMRNSVVVSDLADRPAWVAQCQGARKEFSDLVEPNLKTIVQSGGILSANEALQEVVNTFDHRCLSDATQLPGFVLKRLAVLKMSDSGSPFCTALRVSDSQFLTAKHCFLDDGKKDDSRIRKAKFYMYIAPQEGLAIDQTIELDIHDPCVSGCDVGDVRKNMPAKIDNILISIVDGLANLESPYSKIKLAQVLGDELLIPGYFVFHQVRTKSEGKSIDGIRVDRRWELSADSDGELCRILDADDSFNGCLVHNCQALPGFSGAPLIQRDGVNFSVAGVHVTPDLSNKKGLIRHHCARKFVFGEKKNDESRAKFPVLRSGNLASSINLKRMEKLGWVK
jgi:hypothetical protein